MPRHEDVPQTLKCARKAAHSTYGYDRAPCRLRCQSSEGFVERMRAQACQALRLTHPELARTYLNKPLPISSWTA